MNKKIDFSFVIPTYNESKCIENTLKQFLPYKKKYSFEVIVVDGNSPDNTAKIAKKYADKVIIEKNKTTIANARNLGAYAAKGDVVIEMDAEVIYSSIPGLFDGIKKAFTNPKTVALTARMYIFPSEALLKDKIMDKIINAVMCTGLALHMGTARGECQIFHKELFVKVGGYDKDLALQEDRALFEKFLKVGNIKAIPGIKVYCSPRRFRKEGYLRVIFVYWIWNWFYKVLTGKPYYKTWEVIR
jgi:glycosyltransferase involved in cell wall biosynthesis